MVRPVFRVLLSLLVATALVHGACNTNETGTLTFSAGPGSPLLILSDADGAGVIVTYKPNIDCTWDYECPAGFYAAVLVVGQLGGADYVSLMYLNNTIVQTLTGSTGFYSIAAAKASNGGNPATLVFPISSGRLRFFSGGSTSVTSIGFNATFTCRRSQCSLYNDSSPLTINHLPWAVNSDGDGEGAVVPSVAGEACAWKINAQYLNTLSVGVTFGSLASGDTLALYNGSSSVPLIQLSSSSIWSIPLAANSNTFVTIRYSTSTGLRTRSGFQLAVGRCRVFNVTSQEEIPASRFITVTAFQPTASVRVHDSRLLFTDCVFSSLTVVARCQQNALVPCGVTLQRTNLIGTFRVTASNDAAVRVIDSTLWGSIFNVDLFNKSVVHFERCIIQSTDTWLTAARVSLALQSALIIMNSIASAPTNTELWYQSNYATRSLVLILNSTINCTGSGACEVWHSCTSDPDSRILILSSTVKSGGDVALSGSTVPNVIRSVRSCYKERGPLAPPAVTLDDIFSATCSTASPLSSSWVNKAACLLEEICDPRFSRRVVGNRTNQSCTCICDAGIVDCKLPLHLRLVLLPPIATTSTRTHSVVHSASWSPSAFSSTSTKGEHWSLGFSTPSITSSVLQDSPLGGSGSFTASTTSLRGAALPQTNSGSWGGFGKGKAPCRFKENPTSEIKSENALFPSGWAPHALPVLL